MIEQELIDKLQLTLTREYNADGFMNNVGIYTSTLPQFEGLRISDGNIVGDPLPNRLMFFKEWKPKGSKKYWSSFQIPIEILKKESLESLEWITEFILSEFKNS